MNSNFYLAFAFLIVAALGCGGKTGLREHISGRLNYVEKLKYGSVGTHGSQGWYVSDRYFKVNGQSWTPPGIKLDDIANCDPSPNEAVEALKCYSFANLRESVYLLRINNVKPDWQIVTVQEYCGGKNLGQWTGEGRWLIFKDYFFNVETLEKREIKGMPDYPYDHFLATSPDLKTIVLEESTFDAGFDLPPNADRDEEIKKRYKTFYDHIEKGIAAFWLLDVFSGDVKILEIKADKYDWLKRDSNGGISRVDWVKRFRESLRWEKDETGRDRLVFPSEKVKNTRVKIREFPA